MAAATAVDEEQTTEPEIGVASTTLPVLYKWSTWVHVGPGAAICEGVDEIAGTNDCSNPLHFHGWCRLPNKVQHRKIRDKALAARARKVRLLRDPESDAQAILEEEIDSVSRAGDVGKEALVGDLMEKHWWRDYLEAAKDLNEEEDDEGEKKWRHVGDDQQRFEELAALPEADRPADEFASLERHLASYQDALKERHEAILKPRRDALSARDLNDLLDEMRADRIKAIGDEEFMHMYSLGSWLVGVRRSKNGPHVFSDEDAIDEAAPEVIEALKETYDDLEQSKAQMDAEGNR